MPKAAYYSGLILLALSQSIYATTVSGYITNDATWTTNNSPYVVTSALFVVQNAHLTIDPGVQVQIHYGVSMTVSGGLYAVGTDAAKIIFCPASSQTYGGAIRLNGRSASAYTATGVFEHCDFTMAQSGALVSSSSVLSMADCTLTNMPGTVLISVNSKWTIVRNTFHDTGEVIVGGGQSAGLVASNHISLISGYSDGIEWPGDIIDNIITDGYDPDADGIDLNQSLSPQIVKGNIVMNFGDNGISIGLNSKGIILNNFISGCKSGMSIKDSSTPILANNTIVACNYGINSHASATINGGHGYATNTIIWGCGTNVVLNDGGTLSASYCDIGGASVWPGVGNITNDPMFVDVASKDYRLRPGSPCANRGINQAWMTNSYDLDGNSRIIGAAVDMGAYEFNPEPMLRVKSPNRGESVEIGELVPVSWIAYGTNWPPAATAKLQRSSDGGNSWSDIPGASGIGIAPYTNCQFLWDTIGLAPTDAARVRVVYEAEPSVTDASDADFSIVYPLPVISNSPGATGVTAYAAWLTGTLTSTGRSATAIYVFWGASDAANNLSAWAHTNYFGTHDGGVPFTYSTNITGLSASNTYYYRFYATNIYGETWAEPGQSFTTDPLPFNFSFWSYRMKITFSGYNRTEPLTNFTTLIAFNETLPDFRYNQLKTDGGDLRFTSDKGMELNYEIEKWDTNGGSCVWLQMQSLVNSNSYVWAYWGNPSATAPAYTTNGAAWSQGYRGVWHLNEIVAPSWCPDSTSGKYDGANGGTDNTAGKIAGAKNFAGSDYIALPTNAFSTIASQVTISLWQYGIPPVTNNFLFDGESPTRRELAVHLPWDGNVMFYAFGSDSMATPSGGSESGQWNHWVFLRNGGTMRIYRNGNEFAAASGKTGTYTRISSFNLGGYNYNGIIDEFSVSDVARSSNWIWACWANQSGGAGFSAYGSVSNIAGIGPRGVPQGWFQAKGLTDYIDLEAAENDDPDHDEMTTWEEYYAGTDPTNMESVFMVTMLKSSMNDRMSVTFSSVSGKTYQVWGIPNILTNAWATIQYTTNQFDTWGSGAITARESTTTVYVETNTNRYYRLSVK